MADGVLRFLNGNLAYPSCQPPIQRVFSWSFNCTGFQSQLLLKLPLKAPEEDEKGKQEGTVSLAAAKETSLDAAVVAALSKMVGFFTFKEKQRAPLKDFLCGHLVFASLPAGSGPLASIVASCGVDSCV